MSNKSPLINVIQNSISKVSRRILRDFGEIENLQLSHEKLDQFVFKSYLFIKDNLKAYFLQSRPQWEVIFQDEKKTNKILEENKYYWLIEPINGIENFKRGIPIFAICIAVIKDKDTIASAIFDPVRDEFIFAEKGKGAYLNGRRIRVSNRINLKNSLISVEINSEDKILNMLFDLKEIDKNNLRFFLCSALSFSWVSCGKIECFFSNNINQSVLECGKLILRESGGYFSEHTTSDKTRLIAANPIIHKHLTKIINTY